MDLRDVLKSLRSELGMTQSDLARDLRVNYATVSRWELGKTYPSRSLSAALLEFADAHELSQPCRDSLGLALADAAKRRLDLSSIDALQERAEIADKLLGIDYETIALINASTGEARKYFSAHLDEVISEQKRLDDNIAGVEAYLRRYCVNDDIERVIQETSLPYVKEQLDARRVFSVAYSLRKEGRIAHKRAVYTYFDREHRLILCAMQDITELYELESVKRDQIAAALQTLQELGGLNVARYNLNTSTYYSNSPFTLQLGYGEVIPNVPEEFIGKGLIAPASVEDYRSFYQELRAGKSGSVTAAFKVADGSFHWLHIDARLIYGRDKKPYQAIMSFKDISEEREQAAVYKKWRQSLDQKKPESYTLFRCNLSKGSSFDKVEGTLLRPERFDPAIDTFNGRTQEYAGRFVHLDDYEEYVTLLNSENLLAGYYRGVHTASMDYRERLSEDEYRLLHISVELAQYPDSTDIEAFLMYEPVDQSRAEDPALRARLDSDPLTGVLNRRAFVEHLNALLSTEQPNAQHALILVDIDDFKRINETFGHSVGDQALSDIARSLRAVVREDGILGRLGGDVFIVCLRDISGQAAAEQKASQLLAALRRAFSVDIRVTASLGIAFYPGDGKDFESLYRNVDLALYTAKANGRDSFAFCGGERAPKKSAETAPARKRAAVKTRTRHILLVDDSRENLELLKSTFGDQYSIEVCSDEKNAIACLRRYGISLSAVLLSLDIPGLDSFALLDRIRGISGTGPVPVIALSKLAERELGLKSLRHGASDFILDPVDPELLRIRIDSAVSKTENERLRAQNTYLQAQSSDASQFRTVYENTGTVVVEYDIESRSFVYDPSISEHILGRYDSRPLGQIFMSDMVADVQDVKAMQDMIIGLAASRRTSGTLDIMLKTPSKARHWFTMNAFKRVNDMNMTSKIILTFLDVNDDILASKKLRFQAERDSLTGLYNRATFLRRVDEAVRLKPAGYYILLCCDINDFRFINERFGREEGDRLLQYSADKLLHNASNMSDFAGRIGNDIFGILLSNKPGIIEKITAVMQDFFKDYPLKAKITGRAGAYIISDASMTADTMLDLASTASSSIKGKFGSRLALYDESMNEKRLLEKRISDRMETALAEGQFDVYMQPQFHHATGQIVGAEALVRWIDPERGVVPPAEFIPTFEKNGFITKLDEYVWERTARYISEWMASGNEPVPVSVNVSREDISDPDLCKKLLAIVEKYNIPRHIFRLEITESLFAKDITRLTAVVEELHGAGFLIEMDDFGSGYSSLNILKDVPVDILKLDMKFFSGRDNLGRGGMIINAVLRMSRWLGIPVIAEGVEQKAQADFLLSIGCPTIQGYLYEKPMPAAKFEEMLLSLGSAQVISQNAIDTRLEAHDFWNPLSADSQVFNNYIGPAAVFEYHDGDYEIVRMNKRFIEKMGISESVMVPSGALVHFCEEDRPKFKKAVLEVIYSCKDVNVEVRCALDRGGEQLFRVTLRVIAKSADRALIFGTLEA